jgi:signal transduction histidine kinase
MHANTLRMNHDYMTLVHCRDKAWGQHALTRIGSIFVATTAVGISVPGNWWIFCVAAMTIGWALEGTFYRWLSDKIDHPERLDPKELPRIKQLTIRAIVGLVAIYASPFLALAFAPQPGPSLGLIFACGSLLVICGQHVLDRRMVYWTLPIITVAVVLCAIRLADGWVGYLLGFLAFLLCVNTVVLTGASVKSAEDLIEAQGKALRLADELDERVVQRTRELEEAVKVAEEANRAKSRFLATMSHELRTPLNAVIGYAEMVGEDVRSGDLGSTEADLEKIRNAARHLLGLINEVLDISKMEANEQVCRPTHFDVRAIAQEALDAIIPLAAASQTQCELEIDQSLETVVYNDEGKLRQCLLNLLSNAAKFTTNGTIKLACRLSGQQQEWIAFDVTDSGVGIAEEDLPRIFLPFFQSDTSLTRSVEGTGLGLAISQKLSHLMGGDLMVTSRVGVGSTFTMTIARQFVEPGEQAKAPLAVPTTD